MGQDKFVMEVLENKRNGTFVDLGCAWPFHISNTAYFEREMNWRGIAVDIKDYNEEDGRSWAVNRPSSVHILHDACDLNYSDLFKQHNMPPIIDFLSMDLSPADKTLECLFKIPFDEYKFRTFTFETAAYQLDNGLGGIKRREISRQYIKSKGYKMIKLFGVRRGGPLKGLGVDDFYVLDVPEFEKWEELDASM